MPIIKSAQKKLRQDKKRTERNVIVKQEYKDALRDVRREAETKGKVKAETVKRAYSTVDKATKKNILHVNKASRLKSRVSKLAHKSS